MNPEVQGAETAHPGDALLDAVTAASHTLLSAGDWREAAIRALALLGTASGSDESGVWEFQRLPVTDERVFSERLHWTRSDGGATQPRPAFEGRHIHASLQPLFKRLEAGLSWCGRIEDLPTEERSFFSEQGFHSGFIAPILVRTKLWGFVAFGRHQPPVVLEGQNPSPLIAAAHAIGAAIEHQRQRELLERRDRLLNAVAKANYDLLTARDLQEGISRCLAVVGQAVEVDRVYVFANIPSEGGANRCCKAQYLWNRITPAPAKPTSLEELEPRTYDNIFPGWYDHLARGRPISGTVLDFMLPATATQAALRSILVVPVFSGNVFWGFIGFDDNAEHRAWHPGEESILKTLAGSIGGAIARAQGEVALRQKEDLLRHAQKMDAIGRLAGGVAHDFNNLLTAIIGYGELALRHLPEGERVRDHVKEIKKAAERAHTLTRQLLAFSRRQTVAPRLVDLGTLIGDMNDMLQRLIGETVKLETDIATNVRGVVVDPGSFEQILVNLAVNARDAMPHGGRLVLHLRNETTTEPRTLFASTLQPGVYVRLDVSDTGTGMPQTVMAHLFEPFFTTKEAGKGTGLGLSMVYGIVQQAGGHIHVESEPEKGTTFTVYLPASKPPELKTVLAPAVVSEAGARGSGTILLVEDEEAVRQLTGRVLTAHGYEVLSAACAGEALSIVNRLRPSIDLVLTDIVMPDMDGREMARRLLQESPALRVLYMSGYAPESLRFNSQAADFSDARFMQKPFSPGTLLTKVREAMAS